MRFNKNHLLWTFLHITLGMVLILYFGDLLDLLLPWSMFGPWGVFEDETAVKSVLLVMLSLLLAANWLLTRKMGFWGLFMELSVAAITCCLSLQIMLLLSDTDTDYHLASLCASMLIFGLYLTSQICSNQSDLELTVIPTAALSLISVHSIVLTASLCFILIFDYIPFF